MIKTYFCWILAALYTILFVLTQAQIALVPVVLFTIIGLVHALQDKH